MTLQEAKDEIAKTYFDAHNYYFKFWDDFESACLSDGDYANLRKANDSAAELYKQSKIDEALELAEESIFATIDESRERIIKLQNEFK